MAYMTGIMEDSTLPLPSEKKGKLPTKCDGGELTMRGIKKEGELTRKGECH